MEWSKVKNIILLILLAVNIFLMVQTAGQERQSRQYREEARSGAVEVLRRQGYEVAADALPEERRLVPLVAERDRSGEEKLAQSLLGTVVRTEDSARVSYTGEKGECSFRGDGSFAFTFAPGSYALNGEEAGTYAASLLTKAGYPCRVVLPTEDPDRVLLRQTWEGAPIFSCTAAVTYADGALTAIEGVRLVSDPVPEQGGAQAMNVATALVRFMGAMREGGHVFTSVKSLTIGYQGGSSGRLVRLEPTWSVATDAGVFLMDGLTGTLTAE